VDHSGAIFAFDGPHEVIVSASLSAAEGEFEAIDVENDQFDLFREDGAAIQATTDGQQVVLKVLDDRRLEELRERLRVFLMQPSVTLDPDLADDPRAAALELLRLQRKGLWPRWPRWLHRLVHGDSARASSSPPRRN
jgi:hypothetical protein